MVQNYTFHEFEVFISSYRVFEALKFQCSR